MKLPAGVVVDPARVFYSEVKTDWQSRAWVSINAKLETGSSYGAILPSDIAAKQVNYYVLVTDTRARIARYRLSAASPVSIRIFDARGGLVKAISQSSQSAGFHQTRLDLSGCRAGIYWVRFCARGSLVIKPMELF